jgi:hypothetical protein
MNKEMEIRLYNHPTSLSEKGVTFIFPDGRELDVCINSNTPDMVTIQGDDRLSIVPWANNMVCVEFSE